MPSPLADSNQIRGSDEIPRLLREVSELERMNRALTEAVADERRRSGVLEDRLGALYRSTSWRLSAPLRWLSKAARGEPTVT